MNKDPSKIKKLMEVIGEEKKAPGAASEYSTPQQEPLTGGGRSSDQNYDFLLQANLNSEDEAKKRTSDQLMSAAEQLQRNPFSLEGSSPTSNKQAYEQICESIREIDQALYKNILHQDLHLQELSSITKDSEQVNPLRKDLQALIADKNEDTMRNIGVKETTEGLIHSIFELCTKSVTKLEKLNDVDKLIFGSFKDKIKQQMQSIKFLDDQNPGTKQANTESDEDLRQQYEVELEKLRSEREQIQLDRQISEQNQSIELHQKDQIIYDLEQKLQTLQAIPSQDNFNSEEMYHKHRQLIEQNAILSAKLTQCERELDQMLTSNSKLQEQMVEQKIEIAEKDMQLERNREQLERCEEMIDERQKELQDVVDEREQILQGAEEGMNDNMNIIEVLRREIRLREEQMIEMQKQISLKKELEILIIKASKDMKAKEYQIVELQSQCEQLREIEPQCNILIIEIKEMTTKYNVLYEKYMLLLSKQEAESEELRNKSLSQGHIEGQMMAMSDNLQELKGSKQNLQQVNQELLDIIQQREREIDRLRQIVEDLEQENQVKIEAIEKAQRVIKKLNEESQQMNKDLDGSDGENIRLKKDNKELNARLKELAKKAAEVDNLLKTEEKLKNSLKKMTNDMNELQKDYQDDTDTLKKEIEELNDKFQTSLNQAEEIAKESEQKDDQIKEAAQHIKELIEKNETMRQQISDLSHEKDYILKAAEEMSKENDLKLDQIKSTAEKAIRYYQQKLEDQHHRVKFGQAPQGNPNRQKYKTGAKENAMSPTKPQSILKTACSKSPGMRGSLAKRIGLNSQIPGKAFKSPLGTNKNLLQQFADHQTGHDNQDGTREGDKQGPYYVNTALGGQGRGGSSLAPGDLERLNEDGMSAVTGPRASRGHGSTGKGRASSIKTTSQGRRSGRDVGMDDDGLSRGDEFDDQYDQYDPYGTGKGMGGKGTGFGGYLGSGNPGGYGGMSGYGGPGGQGGDDDEEPKYSKAIVQFLEQELDKSFAREVFLKDKIAKYCDDEGAVISQQIESIKGYQNSSRKDIEGWMMRNEELEQRLFEVNDQCNQFSNVINGLKDIIKTMKEQKKESEENKDGLIKKLKDEADFLKEQIDSKLVLDDAVAPQIEEIQQQNQQLLQDNQTQAERIEDLQKNYDELEDEHDKMKKEFENLRDDLEVTQNNLDTKSDAFKRAKGHLSNILRRLKDDFPLLEPLQKITPRGSQDGARDQDFQDQQQRAGLQGMPGAPNLNGQLGQPGQPGYPLGGGMGVDPYASGDPFLNQSIGNPNGQGYGSGLLNDQNPSGAGTGQGFGLSGHGLNSQGYPGQNLHGQGLPNQNFPGQGYHGQGGANQGFPNQNLPGQGNPGQGNPGQGNPGQGNPGQGLPHGFGAPNSLGSTGNNFGNPNGNPNNFGATGNSQINPNSLNGTNNLGGTGQNQIPYGQNQNPSSLSPVPPNRATNQEQFKTLPHPYGAAGSDELVNLEEMPIDDVYTDVRLGMTILIERENCLRTDRYNLMRELEDLKADNLKEKQTMLSDINDLEKEMTEMKLLMQQKENEYLQELQRQEDRANHEKSKILEHLKQAQDEIRHKDRQANEFANQADALDKDLNEKKKQLAGALKERDQMHNELLKNEDRARKNDNALTEDIKNLDNIIAQKQQLINNLEDKLDHVENALKKSNEQADENLRDKHWLKDDNNRLGQENDYLQKELAHSKVDNNRLKDELDVKEEEIEHSQELFQKTMKDLERTYQELENQQRNNDTLNQAIRNLQDGLDNQSRKKDNELKTMDKKTRETLSKLGDLEDQIDCERARAQAAIDENHILRKDIAEKNHMNDKLRAIAMDAEGQSQLAQELNQNNERLQMQTRAQQDEIQKLRQDLLGLSNQSQQLKTALDRAHREIEIQLKEKRDAEEMLQKEREIFQQIKQADDMLQQDRKRIDNNKRNRSKGRPTNLDDDRGRHAMRGDPTRGGSLGRSTSGNRGRHGSDGRGAQSLGTNPISPSNATDADYYKELLDEKNNYIQGLEKEIKDKKNQIKDLGDKNMKIEEKYYELLAKGNNRGLSPAQTNEGRINILENKLHDMANDLRDMTEQRNILQDKISRLENGEDGNNLMSPRSLSQQQRGRQTQGYGVRGFSGPQGDRFSGQNARGSVGSNVAGNYNNTESDGQTPEREFGNAFFGFSSTSKTTPTHRNNRLATSGGNLNQLGQSSGTPLTSQANAVEKLVNRYEKLKSKRRQDKERLKRTIKDFEVVLKAVDSHLAGLTDPNGSSTPTDQSMIENKSKYDVLASDPRNKSSGMIKLANKILDTIEQQSLKTQEHKNTCHQIIKGQFESLQSLVDVIGGDSYEIRAQLDEIKMGAYQSFNFISVRQFMNQSKLQNQLMEDLFRHSKLNTSSTSPIGGQRQGGQYDGFVFSGRGQHEIQTPKFPANYSSNGSSKHIDSVLASIDSKIYLIQEIYEKLQLISITSVEKMEGNDIGRLIEQMLRFSITLKQELQNDLMALKPHGNSFRSSSDGNHYQNQRQTDQMRSIGLEISHLNQELQQRQTSSAPLRESSSLPLRVAHESSLFTDQIKVLLDQMRKNDHRIIDLRAERSNKSVEYHVLLDEVIRLVVRELHSKDGDVKDVLREIEQVRNEYYFQNDSIKPLILSLYIMTVESIQTRLALGNDN